MKQEVEIWKDIPQFVGVYQISNYGRLKSFKEINEGRVLSTVSYKGSYLSVVLQNPNGHHRFTRIHKLVAEAFIGPPKEAHHVHHKDGNKQNNHVFNIEYLHRMDHSKITIQQNPDFIKPMVNYNQNIRPKAILQFNPSGSLVMVHKNGKDASDFSGVCQRNILQVANKTEYKPGKIRKQAGGFIWEFKYHEV